MRFLRLFGLFLVFISGVNLFANVDPKSANAMFEAAKNNNSIIRLQAGNYFLDKTVVVEEDLTILCDGPVVLKSSANPAFKVVGGSLHMEAFGKKAEFSCKRNGSFIDVNHPQKGKTPIRIVLKNISITGGIGVDGWKGHLGKIGSLNVDNCHFDGVQRCIVLVSAEIGECKIVNSTFENAIKVIQLNAPIPGGVYVCGNTLRNFGYSGMEIGKAGQIADGCTKFVPNAIVHDNRLLSGGSSDLKYSYTHGILIYGHNVSVQGNIVRNVNRGVPVPGAKYGHEIPLANGKKIRSIRIPVDGENRRLAGSAIYLKANRAVVQGNICTNSGWRSVIEIKTGGKEFYTTVVNNVVDGSSLAMEGSFAFECNSGRSLWANNVVYNVPYQAFVVRSGFENTFINNLISDATVGFGLAGNVPGQNEMIAGNRFINVKLPVALDVVPPRPLDVAEFQLPSGARIEQKDELPLPSNKWYGRMVVQGSRIFICIMEKGEYQWTELSGKVVKQKKYRPYGAELLFNSDQSGKGKSSIKGLNDPAFPGWIVANLRTADEKKIDPHSGCFSFDKVNTLTGGRSLKICVPNSSVEWNLRQKINLEPGKRYRATAVVCGDEPHNLRLEVLMKGRSYIQRAEDKSGWQTLSMDILVPPGVKSGYFIVNSLKTSPNKAAWIDSVSLRELVQDK